MTKIRCSLIKGATLGALAFSLAVGPAFAGHGSSGGGFLSKHKSAGSSGGSSGGAGFLSKHKSAGSSGGSMGGFLSKHKSAGSSGGSSGGSY
jgi:hypothetical protein